MRIAMIGAGYVELVSGARFVDFGRRVSCIDENVDRIAALERGEIPIFEPGLNQLVASNIAAGRLDFAIDLKQAVSQMARGADALVIVTEWEQFRALDLNRLKEEMAQPVIVDLRNIYRPEEMSKHGFVYESIGRPRC